MGAAAARGTSRIVGGILLMILLGDWFWMALVTASVWSKDLIWF